MFLKVSSSLWSHHNSMAKKQKPTEKFETAIIVGPMPFAQKKIKTSWKGQLIFIDGGLIHQKKFVKKTPNLAKNAFSVGDGDAPSKTSLSIKKQSQNLSDLAFCLERLQKEKGLEKIILLGFLGGRGDHELFNLGEIYSFVQKNKNIRAYLEDKIEFFPPGKHSLSLHGTFSVASLSPNEIKLTGDCRYQLKKWTKLSTLSSLGLSNEASGEIIIQCKEALMIIHSDRLLRR